MPRRVAVAALLAAAGLALAGCSSTGTSAGDGLGNGLQTSSASPGSVDATGRVAVVAGENVWGDIARQIGGSRVSVLSIISDPSVDPHEYESSLADATAVAHARLVIVNGAGYDEFLSRLLGAAHPSGRQVITVADTVGVHGSNPNPHLWYDPGYVETTARTISQHLTSIDPSGGATFAANLRTFLAGEQRVTGEVGLIKAKYAGTPVGYTERVAGYLVDAAGLRLDTPSGFAQAVEDGTDPNPLDNAAFEADLTQHRVKVLIYNAQVTDAITSHVKSLAEQSHIPVVGMTETMPSNEPDFQTWQLDQAQALLAALGG